MSQLPRKKDKIPVKRLTNITNNAKSIKSNIYISYSSSHNELLSNKYLDMINYRLIGSILQKSSSLRLYADLQNDNDESFNNPIV